jgi:hypothetical protein
VRAARAKDGAGGRLLLLVRRGGGNLFVTVPLGDAADAKPGARR